MVFGLVQRTCSLAKFITGASDRIVAQLAQSSQKPLKRSGDNSVYFTVCMMFLWPR
jgi:hypothetical protein